MSEARCTEAHATGCPRDHGKAAGGVQGFELWGAVCNKMTLELRYHI